MLRKFKLQLQRVASATGLNQYLADTEWRRNKLLILCYHGLSRDDEHEWNPAFFMSPQTFERRLEVLKDGGYRVLLLSEAWERLVQGSLPPKSVVITFDDGMTDFQSHALPILHKFGYPATVYLRTDYCYLRRPVFQPVCLYLLWKQRHSVVPANPDLGWHEAQNLRTQEGRSRAWLSVQRIVDQRRLSNEESDALLAALARHIGIDYQAFINGRILQIMGPEEVTAVAQQGVDIQLHTHTHRWVANLGQAGELQADIEENRKRIVQLTGCYPVHFCYPSGKYSVGCLPELRKLGIATATTCEPALAHRNSNPLLLPRYVDTDARSQCEFEAWLSGVGSLLLRPQIGNHHKGNGR